MVKKKAKSKQAKLIPKDTLRAPKDIFLPGFGRYLKQLREEANLGSQVEVAARLVAQNVQVTASIMAQHETGRVFDPNPDLLAALTRLYNTDPIELVLALAKERYATVIQQGQSPQRSREIDERRWEAIEALMNRTEADLEDVKEAGPKPDLKRAILESRIMQIMETTVLDVSAMASWQQDFRDLEEFWVIAPRFLDASSKTILSSVVFNLRRRVRYCYFVFREDVDRLINLWEKLSGALSDDSAIDLNDLVRAYNIRGNPEATKDWLGTYIVAKSKNTEQPVAYQCIQRAGETVWAQSMDAADAKRLVDDWNCVAIAKHRLSLST